MSTRKRAAAGKPPPKKKPSRRDLVARITDAARASSAAAVHMHSALAARLGLGAADMKACDLLQRLGPMTAGELGAQTGLASASVTSLIDRLEAKGLVRRVRDPGDRRRVIVEAVSDRDADLETVYGPLRDSMDAFLARYDAAQLETIADYLERSVAWAREQLDRAGEPRE